MLNNVTWGSIGKTLLGDSHVFSFHDDHVLRFIATRFLISTYLGAALATATCGGYIIITTGLLIAAATRELRGRKTVIAIFSFFLSRSRVASFATLPIRQVANARARDDAPW